MTQSHNEGRLLSSFFNKGEYDARNVLVMINIHLTFAHSHARKWTKQDLMAFFVT